MHLIVYTSVSTTPESKIEHTLKNISDTAETNNEIREITGVLFYDHGRFLQAIEGEKDAVTRLHETIAKDNRHKGVKILINEPVSTRSFPDWHMDTFYVHYPEAVSEKTLELFTMIYKEQFDMNSWKYISFLKVIINEIDVFRIKNEDV